MQKVQEGALQKKLNVLKIKRWFLGEVKNIFDIFQGPFLNIKNSKHNF